MMGGRGLLALLVVGCCAQLASSENNVPLCSEYDFEMGGGAVPDYARTHGELKREKLLKREKQSLRL